MPRIELHDPSGFTYQICTRQTETLLRAWFQEVLPWTHLHGRPGIDDFSVLWPKIMVRPMWAWKWDAPSDPDWLCDSRVLGRAHEFPAYDGDSGMAELLVLRQRLERELLDWKARDIVVPG